MIFNNDEFVINKRARIFILYTLIIAEKDQREREWERRGKGERYRETRAHAERHEARAAAVGSQLPRRARGERWARALYPHHVTATGALAYTSYAIA